MSEPHQKRMYFLVSLLGIIILLAAAAALALTIYGDLSQTVGNSASNLENYGVAAETGDWIYAVSAEGLSDGLYRLKPDLTEPTLLFSGRCSNLNLADGWVYFVLETKTNEHLLYKIPQEGGKAVLLRGSAYKIIVVGGWIYIEDCRINAISKVKTDGTCEITLVKGYCSLLDVRDGKVYYKLYDEAQDNYSLYRMKTDGSNKKMMMNTISNSVIQNEFFYQIDYKSNSDSFGYLQKSRLGSGLLSYVGNVKCSSFFVDGDWIFYSADDGTYKIRTNGSKNTKISNKTFLYMNAVGNWLFYITDEKSTGMLGDSWILYKMHPDGTDTSTVWLE